MNIKSATTGSTLPSGTTTPKRNALWPIDKLFIAYSAITGALLVLAALRGASVWPVILCHLAAIGLVFVLNRSSSGFVVFLRHWYLLIYVPFCYKEVPYLVEKLHLPSADPTLTHWDKLIGGTSLVVWLGQVIQNRFLTEFLQIIYSMFIPGMVALAVLYWYRSSTAEFRRAGFLISATFLISYLGYLVLPARGPHFIPYSFPHPPLQGLWTFHFLQSALDSLEGVHYDCFPSGHTAVVLVGCSIARKISPAMFWAFCTFSALVVVSTIYVHYHYVIDVLAGILLAVFLLMVHRSVYDRLSPVTAD